MQRFAMGKLVDWKNSTKRISLKFYNLFDLQECMFGCIIFLQSKHIFENFVRCYKGGIAYGT